MLYVTLGLLFAAVFIFILWRVLTLHAPPPSKPETYVCPHCGEQHAIATNAARRRDPERRTFR